MKKLYILVLLLSSSSFFAQSTNKELEEIANAEKKSAFKRMNLANNPNTLNYDVTYHKLEFTVDPAIADIAGKVTTTYTALSNISTLYFDLSDALVVSSVIKDNVSLPFIQNGTNELIIVIPSGGQAAGTSGTVEITYAGTPVASGFDSFSVNYHSGEPILSTLSEPFGAMDWWPCKQDLNDKVNSIDVYITAPTAKVAVSNGLQQSKINNGNGTSTTHFHHGHPIPAYLIAIAVSNYQIYNQQGGLGTVASPYFPIINYMYPETSVANTTSVSVTPGIINYYESMFVPYPFRDEKYGHCQFGWGGGMEHTTVSFMTGNNSGGYSRSLIAHEMAHQWFGDKVTCGSWKDIWLNEGFATYLASMVIQNFDGEAAFINDKNNMINTITNTADGAVYLTDDEALDVNRIFSWRLTYNKGAMVINMLRFKLGDTNFFQGLRNYLNDPLLAYSYAKTPNLQAHLETTSGINLTEFFNDWVYNQGYPVYGIVAHNTVPGQVQITINQTQSDASVSFFEMPVPIRLNGSGAQQLDVVLENTVNGQVFNVAVPFEVTSVTFNPKKDIISRFSTTALGTGNFDLQSGISLYPNPAISKLTLSLPHNVLLEKTIFYNTLGQKIKESTTQTNWEVSDLASGVYLVEIITNLGTKQIKFVKN